MSTEYYPLDPNFFDYYNICHHAALWLVGYSPKTYTKSTINLCNDMAKHLNKHFDTNDAFYTVDGTVLDHAFRLFIAYFKHLGYNSTKKSIMWRRNEPAIIRDYGRFRNILMYGYNLPETNSLQYNPTNNTSVRAQVNDITKKLIAKLNDNQFLDCYQKLDTNINRSHVWWDTISNNFNKNYYMTKLRYKNINSSLHVKSMNYDEGLSRYCNNLKSNVKLCKTQEYIDKGCIPTQEERMKFINDTVPELYCALFEKLISKFFYDTYKRDNEDSIRRSRSKKIDEEWYEHRLNQYKMETINLVETMAYQYSGSSVLTPHIVIDGILNRLGRLTYSVHNIKSAKKTTMSVVTSNAILDEWIKQVAIKTNDYIQQALLNPSKFLLHNIDNYVQLSWLKYKEINRSFTVQVSSISRLVHAAEYKQYEEFFPDKEKPSLFPKMNDWFYTIHRIITETGIPIPDEFKDIRDKWHNVYQGLKDWKIPGNINAKSSKRIDIYLKVIKEFLINECHLSEIEQGMIVDSEFILHFMVIAYNDETIIENLALFICSFHVRMHLVQNFWTDPVSLVLIYFPYLYECLKLQKDKVRVMAVTLVRNMDLLNRGFQVPKPQKKDQKKKSADGSVAPEVIAPILTPDNINNISKYGKVSNEGITNDELFKKSNFSGLQFLRDYSRLKDELQVSPVDIDDLDDDKEVFADNLDTVDDANEKNDPDQLQAFTEAGVNMFFVRKVASLQKNTSNLFTASGWEVVLKVVAKFVQLDKRQQALLHQYQDKKKHSLNYARQLLSAQQLVHCYNEMYDNDEEGFRTLMQADNFICTFTHQAVFHGMYEYGIKLVQDIVLRGNGVTMISKLVDLTKILSYFRREKVVRSLIVFIRLYYHYFTERLDMGHFILSNITKFNNLNVELFNSLIKRIGSEYAEATFDNLRKDSLKVQVSYDIKSQERSELDLHTISSSKGKGEILMQETLHIDNERLKFQIPDIKLWLKNHFTFLSQKQNDLAIELENTKESGLFRTDFNKYSISGMVSQGQSILVGSINKHGYLKRYFDYLEEDKKLQSDRANVSEDISIIKSSKDFFALDMLNVPYLKSFLHSTEPTIRYPYKSKDTKEDNICQILQTSTFKDFLKFCEEESLDTNQDAEIFLDNIIEVKRLTSKKDLNVTKDVEGEQAETLQNEILIQQASPKKIPTNIPTFNTSNNDDNPLVSPPKKSPRSAKKVTAT